MTRHNAQSGDREAIIAIIEAETEAWLRSDTSGWADCWVQAPHAQHIIARPSVGARVLYGFDEIAAYFTPLIEAFSSQSERPHDVRRENWRISIRGDMAWATFEQYIPLDAGEDGAPGRHNQMRILERVDGAWKIAAIFQIPNRIGYYAGPWVRVDRAAHILDMGLGTAEALRTHPALRKVGQKLCTRHTADAEILRVALAEADELISVHRGKPPRPLILNHEHGTGISLAWVSNSDMMIVVLLGDESLLSNTIAHAGRVFGLSRMQVRVATALARGNDSSTIARDLGVQPNTVRTHVRRMFERLEVNSQIALVRTLMSLDPPTH
ncbi:LuxR C-terminal-related transcriptional regulator [Hoeflea sp. WL0058]|uniref:LuxR C-terminal-related transcriptional regulator n=1 Tax=Flavimaribacter sediminis TaxID=2865987 RepID=A0AAE3D0V8_9HYPH|nr:LuxR C-terminal-related transcriptional regulator [Flavimaribacter sediminis]MBW8638945.1 LuxR C-terminal-related transcriptional regulator [Flavimaribacter sediminis]